MTSITINIEIPEKYEYVGYNPPKKGDKYLYLGQVNIAQADRVYPEIIVREKWVRPDWLKANYITKDNKDASIFFWLVLPCLCTGGNCRNLWYSGNYPVNYQGLQLCTDLASPAHLFKDISGPQCVYIGDR